MSGNVVSKFIHTVETLGAKSAFTHYSGRRWQNVTWLEYVEFVYKASQGFANLGAKKGSRVWIWSASRAEWAVSDLAVFAMGGVVVPLYDITTDQDLKYIWEQTRPELVILDNVSKLEQLQRSLEHLPKSIVMDHADADVLKSHNSIGWLELLNSAPKPITNPLDSLAQAAKNLDLSDLATIIYTSGTSGRPKGAMITHANLMAEIEGIQSFLDVDSLDRSLTILPFAHVLGRVEHWAHVSLGFQLVYAQSIERLRDNFEKFRPTFFIGVPRVFEKIHASIYSQLERSSLKRGLMIWALQKTQRVNKSRSMQGDINFSDQLQYQAANSYILSRVRKALGGKMRFALSGGAPLPIEVGEFFHNAGLLILEGYGLTETTGAVAINPPQNNQFGSVGKPLQHTQIKIAADGEILIKGPTVMAGYYGDEEATKSIFTSDGWLKTGDIGTFEGQNLVITDRKKDLIKTAGGKYIAPQKLEQLLMSSLPLEHSVIVGDKRKYAVALLFPDFGRLLSLPDFGHLATKPRHIILQDTEVRDFFRAGLANVNQELASFETIKNFDLIEAPLTPESGELTSSLKTRRHVVARRYADRIAKLYGDALEAT